MLWDIIRDFFVQYVFGGVSSSGTAFSPTLGRAYRLNQGGSVLLQSSTFYLKSGSFIETGVLQDCYISFGDWLSTTATIITLCLLVAFLFLVVRWLFKLVSGLITLRG